MKCLTPLANTDLESSLLDRGDDHVENIVGKVDANPGEYSQVVLDKCDVDMPAQHWLFMLSSGLIKQ